MLPMTIEQAFQIGLRHHQAGEFAQAEAHYRQALDLRPDDAEILHLLGVLTRTQLDGRG